MEILTRLEEKLADIKGYLGEIESKLPASLENYRAADFTLKRATERDLQLINDGEIDVLALLVKLKELTIASSEEGLIDKFNNLLSRKTLNHLREFRRLRNMLTHAYKNEVYDEVVFNSAKKSVDVRTFIKEVERILKPSETDKIR
jgi:uncharacterized protein YutE (UPF0331/DUF86 family)